MGFQPVRIRRMGLQPVRIRRMGLQPVRIRRMGLQPVQASGDGLQTHRTMPATQYIPRRPGAVPYTSVSSAKRQFQPSSWATFLQFSICNLQSSICNSSPSLPPSCRPPFWLIGVWGWLTTGFRTSTLGRKQPVAISTARCDRIGGPYRFSGGNGRVSFLGPRNGQDEEHNEIRSYSPVY